MFGGHAVAGSGIARAYNRQLDLAGTGGTDGLLDLRPVACRTAVDGRHDIPGPDARLGGGEPGPDELDAIRTVGQDSERQYVVRHHGKYAGSNRAVGRGESDVDGLAGLVLQGAFNVLPFAHRVARDLEDAGARHEPRLCSRAVRRDVADDGRNVSRFRADGTRLETALAVGPCVEAELKFLAIAIHANVYLADLVL